MGITAAEVLRNINIGQLCGEGFKQSFEKSPVTMQKRVMEAATGVFSQQNSEETKVKNLFRAVEVIQSGKMTFVEKVRDVWAPIKMIFTKDESFAKRLQAAQDYVKDAETTPENANLERLRKAALLTAYY